MGESMNFTSEEIEEFIDLCEQILGFRPTKEEAQVEASKLIYLVSLIQENKTLTG